MGLRNELGLVRMMSQSPKNLLFHRDARVSGKFADKFRVILLRNVLVDSSYNIHPQSGPYNNDNVLEGARSLMYSTCPSDRARTKSYFAGDMYFPAKLIDKTLKLCVSEKEFRATLNSPLPAKGFKLPKHLTEFKARIANTLVQDKLWSFLVQELAIATENFENEGIIQNIKKVQGIYLHLDLIDPVHKAEGGHWYNMSAPGYPNLVSLFDDLHINILMNNPAMNPFEKTSSGDYVLTKSLLHTVTSGGDDADNQFVGFDIANRDKTFTLSFSDLRLVYYYTKVLRATEVRFPNKEGYAFRLIPSGSFTFSAADSFMVKMEELRGSFFDDTKDNLESAELEVTIKEEESPKPKNLIQKVLNMLGIDDPAEKIKAAITCSAESMTCFDVILVIKGGAFLPDENVSEISNISRSTLLKNLTVISELSAEMTEKSKSKYPMSLISSFNTLHKGERYRNKLVNLFMRSFQGAYYGDPDLMRIFIDRSLSEIRNPKRGTGLREFRWNKFSYEFLKTLGDRFKTNMERKLSYGNTRTI